MSVRELVMRLEAAGAVLTITDGRLRCEVPVAVSPLLSELRAQRHEIARVLKHRLHERVRQWIWTQCAVNSLCSSNPAILRREFCQWSGLRCSQESFVSALEDGGFTTDDMGMVYGLCLGCDFATALEYEHPKCV